MQHGCCPGREWRQEPGCHCQFQWPGQFVIAPDWTTEVVLHRFTGNGGCIHSATLDVDGDGDMDWAGTLANAHPFWLENPGKAEAQKGAWTSRVIDPHITGIHCLLTSVIDIDGKEDLVFNNFLPDKGLAVSIAWFCIT